MPSEFREMPVSQVEWFMGKVNHDIKEKDPWIIPKQGIM